MESIVIIKDTYKLALRTWKRIFIYLFMIMAVFSVFSVAMFAIDALGFKVLLSNDFFYTFNILMSALTYKFNIPVAVKSFQKMLYAIGAVFSNSLGGAILLVVLFLFLLMYLGMIKSNGCKMGMIHKSGYPKFYEEYEQKLIPFAMVFIMYELIVVAYFLACVFGIYGLMLLLMKWGASKALMYIVFVLVVLLCKTDKNALLSSILSRAEFDCKSAFSVFRDEIADIYKKPKENYLSALILAVIQVSSTIVAGLLLHVWGFVLAYFINNFVYISYGLMKYYYNSGMPYTFEHLEHNITAEQAKDKIEKDNE